MAQTEFDPFLNRASQPGATSNNDIRMHLLKATLGSGILSMPFSFMNSGLVLGVLITVLTGFVCVHCAHILVDSAHKLYYKERKTAMTYADVSERAFMCGPKIAQTCAGPVRLLVLFGMFLAYWGTCSVYTVIAAKTFQQTFQFWMNETYNDRLIIASLLIPCILLTWIPDFKSLFPLSVAANIFMFCGLGITFYYMLQDLPSMDERKYFDYTNIPIAYSITIFALQAIGVVLPLENSMATPTDLLGWFGVLSQGLSGIIFLCVIFGFIGYWAYGDKTEEAITLNLPVDEMPAQAVNVLIALAVFCTFGLQFTVCLEIAWNSIKMNFQKRPIFANYVLRYGKDGYNLQYILDKTKRFLSKATADLKSISSQNSSNDGIEISSNNNNIILVKSEVPKLLERLVIHENFDVHETHRIEDGVSTHITRLPPRKQELLKQFGIQSTQSVTYYEKYIIIENFIKFCNEYKVTDHRPFLDFHENGFSKLEQLKFVRYLGQGLPNLTLNKIYLAFKDVLGINRIEKITASGYCLDLILKKKKKNLYNRMHAAVHRDSTEAAKQAHRENIAS